MLSLHVIGALFILGGVVYMAGVAIRQGRLSDPKHNPGDTTDVTLEPRQRGLRFLGVKANWPGIALFVIGVVLMLWPAGVETAVQ